MVTAFATKESEFRMTSNTKVVANFDEKLGEGQEWCAKPKHLSNLYCKHNVFRVSSATNSNEWQYLGTCAQIICTPRRKTFAEYRSSQVPSQVLSSPIESTTLLRSGQGQSKVSEQSKMATKQSWNVCGLPKHPLSPLKASQIPSLAGHDVHS